MHDRMGVEAVNVTFPPVGMAPIRTPHKGPPLGPVPQIDGMLWWYENQRARKEQIRQSVWIVFGCRLLFRKCHVTGIADEFLELPICHGRCVNPEIVHAY